MSDEPTDLREKIARALDYSHEPWPGGIDGHWEQGPRADLYRQDADVILGIVREAQAEALRDAADDLFYDGEHDTPSAGYNELLDRARTFKEGRNSLPQKPRRRDGREDTARSIRGRVDDPRNDELGERLTETFAGLVRELESSRSDSARRLETEIAKREKIDLIAIKDVTAALEQVANIVDPLFDISGLSVEDLKALLNGTLQGRFLVWCQRRREGR